MVIRNAWDNRKKIEINTRANPICVTEPHISVVGAITHDELEQLLPKIPNANGFSNRFLWAMVERTQSLPEGGPPVEDYAAKELNAIREAMIKARSIRGMERSSEARKRWKEIYDNLGTGAGHAMVDRGQPHVLRLSMLFALAEGSSIISLAHLEAAGALWNYCKDCALRLFVLTGGLLTLKRFSITSRKKGLRGRPRQISRSKFSIGTGRQLKSRLPL